MNRILEQGNSFLPHQKWIYLFFKKLEKDRTGLGEQMEKNS